MVQKDAAAVRFCCYCVVIVQCWLGCDDIDTDAQSLSNLNYQIISQKMNLRPSENKALSYLGRNWKIIE